MLHFGLRGKWDANKDSQSHQSGTPRRQECGKAHFGASQQAMSDATRTKVNSDSEQARALSARAMADVAQMRTRCLPVQRQRGLPFEGGKEPRWWQSCPFSLRMEDRAQAHIWPHQGHQKGWVCREKKCRGLCRAPRQDAPFAHGGWQLRST